MLMLFSAPFQLGAVAANFIPKVITNRISRLIRRYWRFGSRRLMEVTYLYLKVFFVLNSSFNPSKGSHEKEAGSDSESRDGDAMVTGRFQPLTLE
jgi:hypothetical protein